MKRHIPVFFPPIPYRRDRRNTRYLIEGHTVRSLKPFVRTVAHLHDALAELSDKGTVAVSDDRVEDRLVPVFQERLSHGINIRRAAHQSAFESFLIGRRKHCVTGIYFVEGFKDSWLVGRLVITDQRSPHNSMAPIIEPVKDEGVVFPPNEGSGTFENSIDDDVQPVGHFLLKRPVTEDIGQLCSSVKPVTALFYRPSRTVCLIGSSGLEPKSFPPVAIDRLVFIEMPGDAFRGIFAPLAKPAFGSDLSDLQGYQGYLPFGPVPVVPDLHSGVVLSLSGKYPQ